MDFSWELLFELLVRLHRRSVMFSAAQKKIEKNENRR